MAMVACAALTRLSSVGEAPPYLFIIGSILASLTVGAVMGAVANEYWSIPFEDTSVEDDKN